MTLYSVFNCTPPSKDSTLKIFNQILSKRLQEFPEDVLTSVNSVTQATLSLFQSISEKLPRTPQKFHYIFNLRNLTSVYEGLYQCTLDKITNKS